MLFGGVGLVLGFGLGYAVGRWWAAVALLVAGAAATWLLVPLAEDPSCEDDCSFLLVVLAGLTNVAGLAVGLALGTMLRRQQRT